eukprot:m.28008 g.28008  ORF g.28008 m.28008 type:complete len:605 (+) comp9004_c0_seq2:277-2091(+)
MASNGADPALGMEVDEDYEPYVPVREQRKKQLQTHRARRQAPLLAEIRRQEEAARRKAQKGPKEGPNASQSLLETHSRLTHQGVIHEESELEKHLKAEQEILHTIRHDKKLMSAEELAKGVKYTQALRSSWRPPRFVRERSEQENKRIRDKKNIIIEGEDVPPPAKTFAELKLPTCLTRYLKSKGFTHPTPIQMQGLPVAMSARDMIGIAFTGSGKTLCFALPAIMLALEQEVKMPFERFEGPYAIIMCPSRELARQTYDVVQEHTKVLEEGGLPQIRTLLCIGQVDVRAQLKEFRNGFHIAVCTPGRLIDLLKRQTITLHVCRMLVMDEADRMVDLGFEEDIRTIFTFFKGQRQTLLFSATMPTKIKDFARSALVQPITVNVGLRAGAASLDVVQEVEYVKPEAKVVYLLECLQKTPPPVMIFSEKKQDVDDIHEYLLLKGVQAVGIHGSKDQEERDMAIKAFKSGHKDVLVATDIASKGLDFPHIRHVINYDMPEELENYIHRIGRTGRSGKTGLATTFINDQVPEITLLDLKYLLIEAKQRLPPYLQEFHSKYEQFLDQGGCTYCGGPGHRITDCPKLAAIQQKESANVGKSDFLKTSEGW